MPPAQHSRGAVACRTIRADIDYRHTTAEDMAAAGEQFDVVLNMEVVEHVADPLAYLTACHDLLKPGGLMVCSTINRNPKSFLMAIIGAEYVMRWLPKGTHEWSQVHHTRRALRPAAPVRADAGGQEGFCFRQAALELVHFGP
jgi:2-polyprenyl-6-hydroxyphenyl methylase / 3-demethylubiquinone-9 3-methyltransferase